MLKPLHTEEFSNLFFPPSPPVRGMNKPQQLTLCSGLTSAEGQMPTQLFIHPPPQWDVEAIERENSGAETERLLSSYQQRQTLKH